VPRWGVQGEAFLKNKLAYVFVCLIRREYPDAWPTCFHDLIKAAQSSSVPEANEALDMLCRIFATLDEEVISLEFTRSSEDIAIATRIKDAIKIDCLTALIEVLYATVSMSQDTSNSSAAQGKGKEAWTAWETRLQVSGSCLDVLQRCISWIDISLVANSQAIAILLNAIDTRHKWQCTPACECFRQMVLKGMPLDKKIALLEQLQLEGMLTALVLGPKPFQDEGKEEDADGFTWRLSSLTSTLWEQLMSACKDLEGTENGSLRQVCQHHLSALFPVLTFFAQHASEEVAYKALPTIGLYVNFLRTNERACDAHQMSSLLQVVYQRLHHKAGECGEDFQEDDDEEAIFERELFHIFRSLAKLSPGLVMSAISDRLQSVLNSQNATRSDVESALTMLMQAGEALPNHMRERDLGLLGGPVSIFFNAQNVAYHQHGRIAEIYMELCVRYSEYLKQNPSFLPKVMLCFLDQRGLRHPAISVQSRASYLLTRLCPL